MLHRLASDAPDRRISADSTRLALGASLFYAICVSFFYFSGLRPLLFETSLNTAMSVICIVVAILASKNAIRTHCSLVFGHILLFIATVFLPMIDQWGVAATLLDSIAAGVGMTIVAPLYFTRIASHPSRYVVLACGAAFFTGMAVNIILWSLPMPIPTLLLACAVIGSFSCLRTLRDSSFADRSDRNGRHDSGIDATSEGDRLFTPIVCTFAISVAYRIVDAIASGTQQPLVLVIAISQAGGLLAALAFVAYYTRAGSKSVSSLLNIIFVLLATGLLFLPFSALEYACILNAIAAAGWKLAMLSLLFVAMQSRLDGPKLYAAISLAWGLPRLGLLCGLGMSALFDASNTAAPSAAFAPAIVAIYVMLISLWVTNYRARKTAERRARKAETFVEKIEQNHESIRKARCGELSERYKLTKREQDVLALLSQGRDVGYICDELFLSKNTVKSYQRSIYAKMGVHSKQEIIDLVKAEK